MTTGYQFMIHHLSLTPSLLETDRQLIEVCPFADFCTRKYASCDSLMQQCYCSVVAAVDCLYQVAPPPSLL